MPLLAGTLLAMVAAPPDRPSEGWSLAHRHLRRSDPQGTSPGHWPVSNPLQLSLQAFTKLRYHLAKRSTPVSIGVVGRKPIQASRAVVSAAVAGTSPGCIG